MSELSGSERIVRLVSPPTATDVGVLAIQDRQRTTFYVFREISCEIGGRAFAMHKLGLGTLYHVRVGAREDCSCECMGFLAHSTCKHILALDALIRAGLVPERSATIDTASTEEKRG